MVEVVVSFMTTFLCPKLSLPFFTYSQAICFVLLIMARSTKSMKVMKKPTIKAMKKAMKKAMQTPMKVQQEQAEQKTVGEQKWRARSRMCEHYMGCLGPDCDWRQPVILENYGFHFRHFYCLECGGSDFKVVILPPRGHRG